MNGIFFAIVLIAFLVAGWRQITWVPPSVDAVSPMQALANGMVETAGSSVTLAIGLVGVMALFLGLMKVAEEGGMLTIIAKTIRPLMVRLSRDTARSSSHGRHDPEYVCERAGSWKRRNAIRYPRNAGARQTQPLQGHGDEFYGTISGD